MALETLAKPVGNQKTLAEAEVRRQVSGDARTKEDLEAAQAERATIQRAAGKRKETAIINLH